VPAEFAQKVADLIGADLADSTAYDAIASRPAFRAAASISSMATRFARNQTMDRLHGVDFGQGLLRRTGGGVADAASRHRAHPHCKGHS